MTRALSLTGADLVRALGDVAASVAVDGAVRARAKDLARALEHDGDIAAQVGRRGPADYTVTASAPGLFAREFGGRETQADPVIGPAIRRLSVKD